MKKRFPAGQRNAAAGKFEQIALPKEPLDERRDVGFPTAKVPRALRAKIDATSASNAGASSGTAQRRVANFLASAATRATGTV